MNREVDEAVTNARERFQREMEQKLKEVERRQQPFLKARVMWWKNSYTDRETSESKIHIYSYSRNGKGSFLTTQKGGEHFRSLENQCVLMIFDVGLSRLMEYYLEICSSHATIRGSKAAFGDGAEDRGWKTKPRRGDLTWMYRILFYHK